ncbi:FIG00651808: hypothetical protein [hydrothermal vent metagenome]|uniref:HTH domain of SpoOJ/ParA/ParB/repB family, involved in chromosome partitioning n=1 Tax=hydrothermal vent metagenome TaxID=652676 RepID=A0A3B0TBI6_9ZZZZ
MAIIKPFKATRPAKDKVVLVASRSYQDYSKKELEAELSFNPFSFLHIINPGYKFHKKVSGPERFKLVHNRFLEFLENSILIKDTNTSFYLYQIEKKNFKCCGLFCGTSVKDYQNDVIKKHEHTMQPREELFAEYLKTVEFNAEPVLMTYADDKTIAKIIERERKKEPEYLFTSTDNTTHSLWTISNKKIIDTLVNAFKKIDSLYIADGHHRSASSNLLSENSKKNNPGHTGAEPYNYFMSYLIPESEIRVYEFNRMVKDLNGLSKEQFLIELDGLFRIENQGSVLYNPSKKHHFNMYLDGEFYSLYLRKKVYEFTDALSELDTQILFKTILEPILGIHDLRNDKRIQYGYGKHNVIRMKNDIDKGKFAIGFSLVPTTIGEIKAIADAGLFMPPKSTYIEPKLRSGLAIYEF